MFEAGFEDIDAVYIDKPDIGALAMAGLQQLSTIDSDVTARRTGRQGRTAAEEPDRLQPDRRRRFRRRGLGRPDRRRADRGARQDSEKIKTAPTEKIYEAMFSGIVGKLDQFSRYAGAQNARENRAARDGFGGIGVRISVEDDEVRVISVMHYTPAERMGLKTDDVITEIDGEPTKGLNQQQVVDQLRGPVDSTVDITIKRVEEADPFVVSITRAHVVPETVELPARGRCRLFPHLQLQLGDRREPEARGRPTPSRKSARASTASSSTCATIPAGCSTSRSRSPTCS